MSRRATAAARVNLGRDTSGRPCITDARTLAMLTATVAALDGRPGTRLLTITQGSYMAGKGANASAGTHEGGGVLDLRTWDLGYRGLTVNEVLTELRRHGFAAWYRRAPHFPDDPHIHAVALGCHELAPGARDQARDYRKGGNGLGGAAHGPDDGPRVKVRTWEQVSRAARRRAARRAYLRSHPGLARALRSPAALARFTRRHAQIARAWAGLS